jgi:spermidine synthase
MKSLRFEMVKRVPIRAVVDLYKEAGWWKESRHARAIIPRMIKGSFCFIIAKTPEGEIAGMGRVISDGASDAYFQDVVVRRDFRSRGVGGKIILRLARYCEKKGLEWIGLVAEPGTKSFYRKLGFKELKGHAAMRKM